MATLANTHRTDKQIAIGDMVYLSLQDYKQYSVHNRNSSKLSKWFYRPFKVVEKIRSVAYRLEPPPKSRIQRVFHLSGLWKAYGHLRPTLLPGFYYKDNHDPELEDELSFKGGGGNWYKIRDQWYEPNRREHTC